MNFSFTREVNKIIIGGVCLLFFFFWLIFHEIQKDEVELLMFLILLPDTYPWSLPHSQKAKPEQETLLLIQ